MSGSVKKSGQDLIYSGLGRRITIISVVLLILVGIVTVEVVSRGQHQVIEFQALELAEIVARLATNARSVYAKEVIGKLKRDGYGSHINYQELKGFVPLPAQFLKYLGIRATNDTAGLYSYKPISKWNLEESQGLSDDFKRWAWNILESQEQQSPREPINWKPAWRIEDINGVKTLRFLRADPAVGQSCVECHNNYEQHPEIIKRREEAGLTPGKQWKLNQLIGAIEVDVPLDKVKALAKDQTHLTLIFIVSVVVIGLVIIGILVFTDVTRARSMAKQLSWQANHDPLTGLWNRIVFEQRLKALIERSYLDRSRHALLVLDLDQFKIINDTCGHIAGDELLRQLSTLLKSKLRIGDTLARLGGDEFGILLENCADNKAKEISETIRQAIQDYQFTWDKKSFQMGVSIGLVFVTAESDNFASLMSVVDVACYAAKDEGRNRVHIYLPSDVELQHRRSEMEWVGRIKDAMRDNRIKLAIQNGIALSDSIHPQTYQEVLLRMIDENGNLVPTVNIISAAERYNLMPTLDQWVINTTLKLINNNQLSANADCIVAINLSGTSLNDNGF